MKKATVKKPRQVRLTKKALLAIALQDAWADAFATEGTPEEWVPDLPSAPQFFQMFSGSADGSSDEDEGDDEEEKREEPAVFFSHSSRGMERGTKTVRAFSSAYDFCKQPFANPKNETLWRNEEFRGGMWRSYGKEKNEEWYGHADPVVAADRAFKGWTEGAERVRSMMQEVEVPPPVDVRRKMNRGDQGDELDVHSVYRGNLTTAWTRRRRAESRGRMNVRIVVPLGGSKDQTQEDMFWRGAATLKLAELLEESGYRSEILACDLTLVDGWTDKLCSSLCVKEAGAPLDYEQVAGIVCNAGFFRTYGFRACYAAMEGDIKPTVIETSRITKKTHRKTLMARSMKWDVNPVEAMEIANDGVLNLVIPSGIRSKESATKFVQDCLRKMAGEEVELETDG